MSGRLNLEREQKLQPERMKFAQKAIANMGYTLNVISENEIQFVHRGEVVKLFPYSGWFSGKSVKDGLGIANLLTQLKAAREVK